jgi:hypothetical protein
VEYEGIIEIGRWTPTTLGDTHIKGDGPKHTPKIVQLGLMDEETYKSIAKKDTISEAWRMSHIQLINWMLQNGWVMLAVGIVNDGEGGMVPSYSLGKPKTPAVPPVHNEKEATT